MSRLDVRLYDIHVGWLTAPADPLDFDFEVNTDVFNHFLMDSPVMSVAVPLVPRQNQRYKSRRQNFFTELLPEGRNLSYLAQIARLSERDTFGLLSRYGLDVAGALEISPEDSGDVGSTRKPYSTLVDESKIRILLEQTAQFPLGNDGITGKTSLAGIQTKIVLLKDAQGNWRQVHNGEASTHIIKPSVQQYPTIIFDEAWGLELARACGISNYASSLETFDGLSALTIERYDRDQNIIGRRIHQEDFSQALGAAGSQKYQEHGGKVSLKRIAGTLEKHAGTSCVKKLAQQLTFSLAIGNLDMHAKNISMLHLLDESIRLSPAYDLVPLQHQDTDGKVALSIDGEYLFKNLTRKNLLAEIASWKSEAFATYHDIAALVDGVLKQVDEAAKVIKPHKNAYPKLQKNIVENAHRFLREENGQ